MQEITRKDWEHVFQEIAALMIANKALLTAIDAKFGDGDHGTTVERIAHVLQCTAQQWATTNDSLKDLFTNIGEGVMNVNGGSAGPLYGTYFEGYGEVLSDEVSCDATLLKKLLQAGLTELQFISSAKVGDKTMMDTLIPATEAAQKAPDDIKSIVVAARDAALQGAEDSKQYVSKFGRARLYGDATIGTPDAGAQSCTYIFEGFYQAIVH